VEFADAWIPEPSSTILGQVVGWETVTVTKAGKESQCEVLTLRTPEGFETTVWTWHAQLRYKLIAPKSTLGDDHTGVSIPANDRLASPGNFVAIHYRGKTMMASGHEAASYRVALGGDTGDDLPF
jgi:hypothetical protein